MENSTSSIHHLYNLHVISIKMSITFFYSYMRQLEIHMDSIKSQEYLGKLRGKGHEPIKTNHKAFLIKAV